MRKHLVVLGVAAVMLTGCSSQASIAQSSSQPSTSSASATAAVTSTVTATASPTATATPTPASAASDATSIATALKSKVPSITGVTTVTQANDANKLLGRPGQYTSAAWIADSGATAGATGIDGGAVVETFATAADAQTRSEYIQGVLKKMGPAMGTEWHHLKDATLVRVSGKLNPSVNDQYTKALGF